MNRRSFLYQSATLGAGLVLPGRSPISASLGASNERAIPIDVGRQLFVDDYLISETTCSRSVYAATQVKNNPILQPETPLEKNGGICPVACPFEDGVFYDAADGLFKMWYHAGWFDGLAIATSTDGLVWHRPSLDVEIGTNRVLPVKNGYKRDGATVWLDHEAQDPAERYKMFVYFRSPGWEGGQVYLSSDGFHWNKASDTSPCGDNTSFYRDPFRKKWVYSIRTYNKFGRVRSYRAHSNFIQGATWKKEEVIDWLRTDELDLSDPQLGYPTQLYKFSAVAYESLMLGCFAIFKGPPNEIAAERKIPKTIDLTLGFSRDGFHWDRVSHDPFLACSRVPETWNRGYLHSAGGLCLVMDDHLRFYFGAFSGLSPKLGGNLYAGGSTGVAILRRDGFASLDAGSASGLITTRPLAFSGSYLFVNADARGGEIRVELLDSSGRPIREFSAENCIPMTLDSTRHLVTWKRVRDVSTLSGQPVRFRFHVKNAKIFSFWVSSVIKGASFGYVGAGGSGFPGNIDSVGGQRTE